jgi:hypothetical protein
MIIHHLAVSLEILLHPSDIVRAYTFTGLFLLLFLNYLDLLRLLLFHVYVLMAAHSTTEMVFLIAFTTIIRLDFDSLLCEEISTVFVVFIIKVTYVNTVSGPVMILADRPILAQDAENTLVPPIVVSTPGTIFTY